ncbi:MAG: PAS domain S-box protein, partial [Planctomycetaceae bacterium]
MRLPRSLLISAIVALAVFLLDYRIRGMGSAESVLYLWPLWVAARTGDLRWALRIAAVVSVLTVAGAFFERPANGVGFEPFQSVRGFVLLSIWGTVLAVLPLIEARRQLLDSEAKLREETDVQRQELVQVRQEKSALEIEAEQALRDSEALYHSLVDHLPLSVLRKDRQFRYTFANKRYLEFAGRDQADVLEKTDFDLFPEHLAREYRRGDEQVLATGRLFENIESYQRPDGEVRWIQVLKSPIYDAQHEAIGTQILLSDVTDRQRAEEALARSKQQLEERNRELQQSQLELQRQTEILESILQSIADGVVVADERGEFLLWNPAAQRIIGLGATDTPRDAWPAVYGLFQADRVTPFSAESLPLARAIRGETVENCELYVRNPERAEGAMISVNGMPLRDRDGGVRGGVVVFRDVTELKAAEAEIRAKNADLETLLYVTSHDLREPLRAIENFSKLVVERYADRLDEKGRDFLNRVVRAAGRLDRLLQDVLTLSRVQRTTCPDADIDSEEIVADALRQLEPRIRETSGIVRVIRPLPALHADRRWATQAVYNLVSNAIKYTRAAEPPDIEIAGYEGAEGVGLVVRDRGMGVPPEYSERIFQLFQRVVGREVEGTGAGLAIVRRVAERHGGKAWVWPRAGGGSEFVVTF